MRYCSLASGSSGNCHYVEAGGACVLVDIGISLKAAEANMYSVGLDPSKVQAVFVTHEHSDHVKGIGAFVRKYQIPVFATEGTWQGMQKALGRIALPRCYTIRAGHGYRLANMRIQPFLTYHDANEPVGYQITAEEHKLIILTDTGMVSDEMRMLAQGADIVIAESNHDPEMLMNGPYPAALKHRIRSNLGHLSNVDCGFLLSDVFASNPYCQTLLAHLSEDNNTPEIAWRTVLGVLYDRLGPADYRVGVAPRNEPSAVLSPLRQSVPAPQTVPVPQAGEGGQP
ncbi:MAG: MBL fold metallo-hydrolase [Firmicutes bacterium]|nr:MBL fold metallo-hydrolase [Bacillota bacterium]